MAFNGPPSGTLHPAYKSSRYYAPVYGVGLGKFLPALKRKVKGKKKPKYISTHEKVCPFVVGQIIFNKKRPTIRRLVIGEPKLINKTVWSRHRTCWEIPVLNLRKNVNNGKKSMLVIELTRLKSFDIFSDFEVASVLECAIIE